MVMPPDPLGMLTPQDLRRPLRPALFIDKDGTLIENVPYNVDPALLRFMPGAGAALARLQRAGLALVIVTNQSGLARGLFTREQFDRLAQALQQRLRQEFGVVLDGLEMCPHGPGDDGAPTCPCRKPAPGMLIRAAHQHGLDLARSWIVGDTLDDVEAGHRAGCGGLLFHSGGETVWRRSPLREPDAGFHDWTALAEHVERQLRGHAGCPGDGPSPLPPSATGDLRCSTPGTAPSNAFHPAS